MSFFLRIIAVTYDKGLVKYKHNNRESKAFLEDLLKKTEKNDKKFSERTPFDDARQDMGEK